MYDNGLRNVILMFVFEKLGKIKHNSTQLLRAVVSQPGVPSTAVNISQPLLVNSCLKCDSSQVLFVKFHFKAVCFHSVRLD